MYGAGAAVEVAGRGWPRATQVLGSLCASRLVPISRLMAATPVTLPPGRLRLATRPRSTGSPPVRKTIGMVVVAALAANVAAGVPGLTITATRRRTRSSANPGRRSVCKIQFQRQRQMALLIDNHYYL